MKNENQNYFALFLSHINGIKMVLSDMIWESSFPLYKVDTQQSFWNVQEEKEIVFKCILCFRDGRNCMSLISVLLDLEYAVGSMALYYFSTS